MNAPRNARLKATVIADLAALQTRLNGWVKAGFCTADSAFAEYMTKLAAVVRDPSCRELDERNYMAVKCRACRRETSVPDEIDAYACRCTPTIKRIAFMDRVDSAGAYAVDEAAMAVSA